MGKSWKKSLIISLGVLMFGVAPNMVDAASFSWGTKTTEDNVTRIPVILEVGSEDIVNTFKINCETNHTDVTCLVNKLESDQIVSFVEDTVTFVGDGTLTSFPAGKHTLVELVLTNESSSKMNDIEVSLKNSSIEGVAQTKSIKTSVGPKPVEKVKSSDPKLKSVKFSQGTISPEFNPETTEYTVYKIADTINSVRVTPTCNEGECTFDLSGGKSTSGMSVTLNQGENTIKLEVFSEDGQNSLTYTFKVYRGETTYNSAKLSELSFGDYTMTPAFSKDTKEYSITIPNAVNNVVDVIKYAAEDKNAKVEVEGIENLVVGTNTLKVVVNNVTGDETVTYKVTINRLSEENIEVISYKNGEVTFKDADGIQTTLSEDVFKTQYPKEYEKIEDGTYKFDKDGNVLKEEISEEEDTSTDDKEEKKDNKVWLIVLLIVIGLIVIVVSGILIFRKKTPKTEEIDNKENTEEEIDETGLEESVIGSGFSSDNEVTVDIDEALSDLMSTKQYEFKDKEDE